MAALDDLIPAGLWAQHADNVEKIARRYYAALFEAAYGASKEDYGLAISFDVSNPRIKDAIDGLATRVRSVADTTREDIRRLVDMQTEQGWSMRDLAEQIRSSVDINSVSRSMMIARTESATAYNVGGLLSYEDAGITEVDVMDGDQDEACNAANGQVWTLEEAHANPIAHPNCVRAFAPRVGGG